VTPARLKPVSTLRTVTVTPGNAAFCASMTVPITVAVSCCAFATTGAISA
jgi:hypothetical protein